MIRATFNTRRTRINVVRFVLELNELFYYAIRTRRVYFRRARKGLGKTIYFFLFCFLLQKQYLGEGICRVEKCFRISLFQQYCGKTDDNYHYYISSGQLLYSIGIKFVHEAMNLNQTVTVTT